MDDSSIRPLPGRPRTGWNGGGTPQERYANLGSVPAEMNDLAYLVNQVQRRAPPIMRAHARYADDRGTGEPTVLVINTDSGELLWRVPLTGLLQLTARFLRMNPRLVIGPAAPDIPEDEPRLPQRRSPRPTMNDLAYLVNSVREPQRPVIHAHAEFEEHGEGEEPTVRIVNSANHEVLLSVEVHQLLRLAAKLKINSGLVFQGQA